jgi:hypothetical protein
MVYRVADFRVPAVFHLYTTDAAAISAVTTFRQLMETLDIIC